MALMDGRTRRPDLQADATAVRSAAQTSVATGHTGARDPKDVMLRYLGLGAFSTRSLRTGRGYVCVGNGARLAVDLRDAESLLRTRQFTRA
jgi:hypothetical protein